MQAYAHLMWAELMLALGKTAALKEHAGQAAQLFQQLDKMPYASVLYSLSERQRFQPHGGAVAQRTAEEAVSIWKEIGNYKGEATAMTAVAKAMIVRGLTSDALQMVQTRMQELRQDNRLSALAQTGQGCECGAKDEALATAEEVLAITQQLGNRHEEAWMLIKLSEVRSDMKLYEEALLCAQEAQTIFQELGDQCGEAEAMKSLSHIYTAKREAHKSPHRQRALDLLSQFATSVANKDVEGFQKALTQMRLYQGVDGQDVAASLGSLMQETK
eukprot:g8654.t1